MQESQALLSLSLSLSHQQPVLQSTMAQRAGLVFVLVLRHRLPELQTP